MENITAIILLVLVGALTYFSTYKNFQNDAKNNTRHKINKES